ncbi:UNVERIFIED_CONTAM: hypothetical protein FKN15_012504 [Acipenser sinensis]
MPHPPAREERRRGARLDHLDPQLLTDSQAQSGEHRNWCPYSITKTVSCQVQNGTTLQRVYQSCRWPQGCTGGSYRTVLRPSYKVAFRTVSAMEWKCCPGYRGEHCEAANVHRFSATY